MKLARKLLEEDLKKFDIVFADSLKSKLGLLDKLIKYVSYNKGKQLRPILVMLSARLFGPISDETYRSACLIEYLHSATVIHDDVVDESFVRRSSFSVKALWGNKLAVILGDYMLSKGLLLSLENQDFESLTILSTAVKEMVEAEMLQFEKNIYNTMNEKTYYDVIRGKTASLFAAACSVGAWTASKNKSHKENFYEIGENLGMAFQIKDDLFDYESIVYTGKPSFKDFREKKATLPFLYAFQQASNKEKHRLLEISKKEHIKNEEMLEVVSIIRETGGIDYASKIMVNYANNAIKKLKTYPDSVERIAIEDIIQYIINRVT